MPPDLIPVDHDPFNSGAGAFSLIPVDHDPFGAQPVQDLLPVDHDPFADAQQVAFRPLNPGPLTVPTNPNRPGHSLSELLEPGVAAVAGVPGLGATNMPTVIGTTAGARTAARPAARGPDELAGAEGMPGMISPRLPTAPGATENPMTTYLPVTADAMRATNPKQYETNLRLLADYPGMPKGLAQSNDLEAMRQITHQHQVDNLLALHDAVPNAVRPRSALWYDGMNSIIQDRAQRYGISQAQAAGNYAGLSPQKDWYMNVGLGDRVADAIFNHGSQVFDPRMVDAYTRFSQVKGKDPAAAAAKTAIHMQAMNELVGRRLDDLDTVDQKARFIKAYDMAYNPRTYNSVMPEGDFGPPIVKGNGEPAKIAWSGYNELGSAVTSLLGTNMPDISNAMGARHKVRFFYNSGMYPNSPLGDYVSDTHDVAARLFRPLSGSTLEVGHNLATRPIKGMVGSADSAVNGFKGTYAFGADAGRDAAAQRGLLPRQMQSISWEGVRGLFPKAYKNDTNKDVVDSIWGRVSDGTLAPQDARQLIMRHAGARGGNNFVPNWFSGRPIVEEGE